MKRITPKGIWHVLKCCFAGFSEHKVTKLSASLAYYTIFSLAPLMILIVFISSFFFGKEAVEGSIYGQISGFVGQDAALQLQEIIKNAALQGKGNIAAIVGGITLLIGATTIFAEIQDSINSIWGLKPKPKQALLKMLMNRLLSFSLIVGLGFVALVSLVVNSLMDLLNGFLKQYFSQLTVAFFYVMNLVLTLAVVTLLFTIIFKVLPDAIIRWKDAFYGAVFTGLLFILGKFLIGLYLGNSNLGITYGAAASMVVILTWVYYSSIILYFGAEFTEAYAQGYGGRIRPSDTAVFILKREVRELED